MNYNLDIPGWMSETDLLILSRLASHVPENGNILEVGSFLGRSTYALYAGKPASAHLEIVDTFKLSNNYSLNINPSTLDGSIELINDAKNIASKNGNWLEAFKHCITPEIADQLTINSVSSEDYELVKHFDMIFIDANHSLTNIKADIKKFVNATTLLVGDDFGHDQLGVPIALGMIRSEVKGTLIVPENSKIWIMVPSTGYWKHVFQTNILY